MSDGKIQFLGTKLLFTPAGKPAWNDECCCWGDDCGFFEEGETPKYIDVTFSGIQSVCFYTVDSIYLYRYKIANPSEINKLFTLTQMLLLPCYWSAVIEDTIVLNRYLWADTDCSGTPESTSEDSTMLIQTNGESIIISIQFSGMAATEAFRGVFVDNFTEDPACDNNYTCSGTKYIACDGSCSVDL